VWVWVLGVSSSDNHPPVLSLKNWSPRVRGLGIPDASWRAIAFVIVAMALGGCMQETLAPTTQVGWSGRDKQLMSNLPYAQASIPVEFQRHIVNYSRKEAPGTVVVDTANKFLYYVLPKGQAIRYGITVGEDAQAWSGLATVGPPANTHGLDPYRPLSLAGRKIQWVRAGFICTPVERTRSTVSTAPTSPNISAVQSRRAASG